MTIIDFILPSITVVLSGFSGWLFSRKKKAAEVETIELSNAEKVIEMHKELAMSYRQELDRSKEVIDAQQKIIENFNIKCIQIGKCTSS